MNKYFSCFIAMLLYCSYVNGLVLTNGYSRSGQTENSEIVTQMISMGAYGLEAYVNIPGDDFYYTMMGGVLGHL